MKWEYFVLNKSVLIAKKKKSIADSVGNWKLEMTKSKSFTFIINSNNNDRQLLLNFFYVSDAVLGTDILQLM